jgi:pimeloyl-ACP methyl ester carboxylesterase
LQAPKLIAFEHTPTRVKSHPENVIIWIGGLGDGILTVPYTRDLARAVPPNWAVIDILLNSSYTGWGTSNLQKDVAEIAQCVHYLRHTGGKTGQIVLMGHSTGCQDVMEYLTGRGHERRPHVDGAIIQASVSDREAMNIMLPEQQIKTANELALSWVASGRAEDVLPSKATEGFFDSPVSAYRWLSLASPNHDGDDDYFSSDLPLEKLQRTFGKLPASTVLCILYSGEDEYVPKQVDRKALVQKWIDIVKAGTGRVDEERSGVVPGATHNLKGDPHDVVNELLNRVVAFVTNL